MGLSLRGHLTTTSLSSVPGWSGSLTGSDPYETRTDTSRPWLLNMTWSWCFISHATASHPVVLARETLLLRGPQRRAQRDDPPRHGRTRDREAQIVAEVVSDASLAPVPDLRQKRHPALLRVGLLHVGGVYAHDRVLVDVRRALRQDRVVHARRKHCESHRETTLRNRPKPSSHGSDGRKIGNGQPPLLPYDPFLPRDTPQVLTLDTPKCAHLIPPSVNT